jgi:hypothetical protein
MTAARPKRCELASRDRCVTISREVDDACGIEVRAHPPQNPGMAPYLPITVVAIQLAAASGVPPKTLHAAQERAAHILASARIKPLWVDRADLQLQIVATELRGLTSDAAGFAVLIPDEPGYAEVSWPAITSGASQMEVDAAVLLGAVIAHELGHLLFGRSHTHSGVMSPRLGPKEIRLASRGELRFENGDRLSIANYRNPPSSH